MDPGSRPAHHVAKVRTASTGTSPDLVFCPFFRWLVTPPETKIATENMDGWKTRYFPFLYMVPFYMVPRVSSSTKVYACLAPRGPKPTCRQTNFGNFMLFSVPKWDATSDLNNGRSIQRVAYSFWAKWRNYGKHFPWSSSSLFWNQTPSCQYIR